MQEDKPQKKRQAADIGMHVVIELVGESGEDQKLELDIVPDADADFYSGFLGENTPLARVILHKYAGDEVDYEVGGIEKIRILEVTESLRSSAEASEKRTETINEAIKEIERTNAMIFSSSYSGKWGDYDPEGMKNW